MAAQDPFAPPPTPSQDWLTPGQLPPQPHAPPSAASAPIFELRPLSTGELLDRCFTLYRSRFWLFAGVASVAGALQASMQALQLATRGMLMQRSGSALTIVTACLTVAVAVLYFLAYSVTSAATAFAVGEIYLGRGTTIKAAFAATIRRWYAYVGIAFWQACSMAWLPVVLLVPGIIILAMRINSLTWLGVSLLFVGFLGGGVGGYILFLRNMLAVPAVVTERLKVRAAMRRSKVLTPGTKLRLFVLHLIYAALYMVVGVLQAPLQVFVFLAMAKGNHAYPMQAVMLIVGFVGQTVVSPVVMIGLTLAYFDQRVRKEAFDIAVLMGEEHMVEMAAPPVTYPGASAYAAEPPEGHVA